MLPCGVEILGDENQLHFVQEEYLEMSENSYKIQPS